MTDIVRIPLQAVAMPSRRPIIRPGFYQHCRAILWYIAVLRYHPQRFQLLLLVGKPTAVS